MIPVTPFYANTSIQDEAGKPKDIPVQVVGIRALSDNEAQFVVIVKNGTYCYADLLNDVELLPQ